MKKQSLFLVLTFILSACVTSQQSAPIEYNNRGSKTLATKTNPTINDEGEVISTGIVEVKENEIISPNDKINEEPSISGMQHAMSTKSKIIYHEVQVGETIEEIATKYGVKITEIANLNDLASPYYLDEFQVLKIKQIDEKNIQPSASIIAKSDDYEKPVERFKEVKIEEQNESTPEKPIAVLQEKKPAQEFIMPIKGKILAKFGDKTQAGISKGISIGANAGAEVQAAASGKVIYADYDATYGNLVIIKLDGKNIVTSYAHLQDIILHKGAAVKQGDLIGHVGNSGKVKEPQLNFGIREGKVAKDPAKFLKY